HSVPVDLKKICLRSLRKRSEDRYLTAGVLAHQLDLFLRGFPLDGCSWPRRGLYFTKRHRIAISLACASLMIIAGMTSLFLNSRWQQRLSDANERFNRGEGIASNGHISQGVAWMRQAIDDLPLGAREARRFMTRGLSAWTSRQTQEVASVTLESQ